MNNLEFNFSKTQDKPLNPLSFLFPAKLIESENDQNKITHEITDRRKTSFYEKSETIQIKNNQINLKDFKRKTCLLYTSPSPRDLSTSRMPSSA